MTMPGTHKIGAGGYQGRTKVARGFYDFAVDGGAVGTITLRGDTLPAGAIAVDSLIDVDTVVTSGGAATVAIGFEAATNIRAAATLSTAPALDATGPKRSAVLTATAAPVETTQARAITATVATAALTAGKFSVLVWYVELA